MTVTATTPVSVCEWSSLADRQPTAARVANVDLVVVRWDERVSVLYGRCLHRGALLADGRVEGPNLICGLHDWDYRLDTGVSAYDNSEVLHKFTVDLPKKHGRKSKPPFSTPHPNLTFLPFFSPRPRWPVRRAFRAPAHGEAPQLRAQGD